MIERNPITGDPVIVAPERAARPNAFREDGDRCPFCPGHESDTPPEIWRDGDPWRIRIFPNKYPASEHHEVIVESPDHSAPFDRLAPDHAAAVVDSYISRYHSLSQAAEYVCVFKNHGLLAGATIPHPHSQVIATPFVPPRIVREGSSPHPPFGHLLPARRGEGSQGEIPRPAKRRFKGGAASGCALCTLSEVMIDESDGYRWIAPRGSMMAFEQWIVPKRHQPEMTEGLGLATFLQRSARGMLSISSSFNWIFVNFPRQPDAHWYVQLFPRTSMYAGFEFGTDSAINTVDAADAARIIANIR